MSDPGRHGGLAVAMLSPCFWPEVRRGGERLVRDLADGLISRGHRPRLITSHPGLPSRSVEDGLPITRHWRPPEGRLRRRQYVEYLSHAPWSYLSLRFGRDDLAHAVYPTDAVAAARWSARSGRPTVFTYLGIPTRAGLTYKRYQLEVMLRAVEGSTAVVALSRAASEAFRWWLGVDARVIHPGVDLRVFRPGPRADAPTVFCGAALDEPRKRVGLLVSAFEHVRRERPAARLVLSRPRDPASARLVATGPAVELRDVDDRAALARAYAEAWVSVLPSYNEAFGLVLAEAMACGTPVVGSNRDGIREVVDREAVGRLFDGDDERSLAATVLEALELSRDPATAEACRRRAEELSTDRSVEAYERLYRELLER